MTDAQAWPHQFDTSSTFSKSFRLYGRYQTMGHYKLNYTVTPIAAVLSNMVPLLENINTAPGIWYVAMIRQMLSFLNIFQLARTRRSLLLLGRANNIPSQSCLRVVFTYLLCHNLVCGMVMWISCRMSH